jgi:hypothetical protein
MSSNDKLKVPEEFAPIDGMMRLRLSSDGAPDAVKNAWQEFVKALSEWKCPQGESDVKEE